VNIRPTRLAVVTALAVVALLGTACGAPTPPPPPPPAAGAAGPASGTAGSPTTPAAGSGPSSGTPSSGTPSSGSPGVSADQIGPAHQAALGLIALGGLGTQKGSEAIHSLADKVTSEGKAIDEQIRALATAQGLGVTDDLDVRIQRVVSDLQSRTGAPFDQAWLRAVGDLVTQARDAANAVLSSPTTSEDAKAAARDALARLDALAGSVRDATNAAGAGTPKAVNAGTGGQAAEAPILPSALVGLGALLLGSAVVLRRRRA
jgi:predicted outer membrane protein